ncbi:MAG: rhomboid family intramembrane serine protease [Blastocatellales bacterium]
MYSEENESSEQSPFRICESCGQLTPRNQPQCAYCGAVSIEAVAEAQFNEERRFFRALFSRSSPVSYLLIAVNVIYYAITSWYGLEASTLIAFGAKTNALLREGDWYRLVTPIFIHGGLLHLGFNSYALYLNGPLVEKLYGSARFLFIYLLSGIGGVAGSYLWQEMTNHPDVPSVGASGAIFGLFGLLAVFGYKYKEEVPENLSKALRSSVLPVIAVNLIIGFSLPFIDNGAHLGGLLVGALLALLIPYLPLSQQRVSVAGLLILVLCFAVIALSFWGAIRHTSAHLGWRVDKINSYLENIETARKNFAATEQSLNSDTSSKGIQAKEIQTKLADAIAALNNAEAPDQISSAISSEMLSAARKQQELLQSGASTAQLQENFRQIVSAYEKYENWYNNDLKKQAAQHSLTFGPEKPGTSKK